MLSQKLEMILKDYAKLWTAWSFTTRWRTVEDRNSISSEPVICRLVNINVLIHYMANTQTDLIAVDRSYEMKITVTIVPF